MVFLVPKGFLEATSVEKRARTGQVSLGRGVVGTGRK